MGKELARLVKNLRIKDMHYISRDGTSVVGSQSGTPLIYATTVKLSTGKTWTLRWRTDGVDYFKAGDWTTCDGDRYSASATTQVSVTGWSDSLVFTIGSGHLYSIGFSTGEPVVSEILDSPVDIGHVTTFASRIIASDRAGSTVWWCVKLNNLDWSGQGSGFEDLRSAPGRSVDNQTAVQPVTDEYAYSVRTNSIWQMSLTGDPDAPFKFSLLYSGFGSEYPGTVVGIYRGVVFATSDSVMKVTPDGYFDIGYALRDKVRVDKQYLRDSYAAFDPRDDEYVLSLPNANSLNAHEIYRFKLTQDQGGWVQEIYPFPVKSISFTRYVQTLTIDELTGRIDELIGTIDDLGQTSKSVGLIFAGAGASKLVMRNDETVNTTPTVKDVNSAGVAIPSGWRVETGFIVPNVTTKRTTVVRFEIEYEADVSCDLTFEYCDDGLNWTEYAAKTALATNRPRLLRVSYTLEREALQLAVNCEASPNFRLIALHVYAHTGADIEDAR